MKLHTQHTYRQFKKQATSPVSMYISACNDWVLGFSNERNILPGTTSFRVLGDKGF